MRVSRSLTIKQMTIVAGVTLVFIFVFCLTLLFHFVQQNRYMVATQLETVARSVREPLSSAILKGDIPEAEAILRLMKPSGIVSRADVVLPNQFQALGVRFIEERPVPVMITRLFELPIQISLPIYALQRPANPQPLAYLVLQSDAYRTYKFVMSALSTLVTAYLLLVLMLTVGLTWCISRFIVRPLRAIAHEINDIEPQQRLEHRLTLPPLHGDDEIGMLVRSYNRHQQMMQHQRQIVADCATGSPQLPDKAFLLTLLEQIVSYQKTTALIVIACDTLQETAEVLTEQQREIMLLALIEKIKSTLSPSMVLTQINHCDFAIVLPDMKQAQCAVEQSKQILVSINERLPLQGIHLYPSASIGIAILHNNLNAGQLYDCACSAAFTARSKGTNQIELFDSGLPNS